MNLHTDPKNFKALITFSSMHFKTNFSELLVHNRETLGMPEDWRIKDITESPLVTISLLW